MSQSGLRHAATEPDHLDAKRERSRRGGGGRAAVLRRAPSDSDCSAETASLSADSADRVRPVLVPVRTAKARSRRRGSEWEVLEGLKDGQRFERRPEVFNGYLHKKRKWPLKGWHKRFFVIDGGILVYARSPADVARGRLHGSVDVGLSVISAKARRRRVDIDADEFIYHLRAKTPDVFRTWLNVLKVHRLYRQHLLTFGAREAGGAPKHAVDDLPPADTSTPTTSSSYLTPYSEYSEENYIKLLKESVSITLPPTPYLPSLSDYTPVYWNTEVQEPTELLPLTFETLEENYLRLDLYSRSLCSMNCLEKIYKRELAELLHRPIPESVGASITEKQLHSTELENSLKIDPYVQTSVLSYAFNSFVNKNKKYVTKDKPIKPVFPVFSGMYETPKKENKMKSKKLRQKTSCFRIKHEPTTTFFLFTHKKKRPSSPESQMKRSKKSTNLVKYRNCSEEPPLEKPFSAPMLLKKIKTTNRVETSSGNEILKVEASSGNQFPNVDRCSGNEFYKITNGVQASIEIVPKKHKSLQDTMTAEDYDKITEQLIISIFRADKSQNSSYDIRSYVNQMVKELYDVKLNQVEAHPVKTLFRCLLEFWLKNSSSEHMKNAIKSAKSVVTQSINFTRDENLSTIFIPNIMKETQIQYNNIEALPVCKTNQLSFMKERRIQELETLLKNTVYTFETAGSDDSKEKDIEITKRLLDNLDNLQRSVDTTCTLKCQCDSRIRSNNKNISGSSVEYSRIKETVERLISETSMPPDCLREFLGAYLKVLRDDSITQSSDDSRIYPESRPPFCDVQTESVQKKVSIGVYTVENNTKCECAKSKGEPGDTVQDSGQRYLKDVLDRVTTIFARQINQNISKPSQDKHVQPDDTKVEGSFKDIKTSEYVNNTLIPEYKDDHSVVLDLTKYDLEDISMYSNPTIKGSISITIKLKERSRDSGESKQKNINLNFSEETSIAKIPNCTTKNYCQPKMDPPISFKNPYIHYDPNTNTEKKDLKSVGSASDASSKAYKSMYQSENSKNFVIQKESKRSSKGHDDRQSSIKKNSRSSVLKSKNKCRVISREQSARFIPARRDIFNKTVPDIDDNFIILLLENLTLLSERTGLYKEISVFYHKLKRKHERERNGLRLLGKIYNENNQTVENMRQGDSIFPGQSQKPLGSNSNPKTENNSKEFSNKVDQGTSVIAELKDAKTQCNEFFGNKTTVNLAVSTSSNPFGMRYTHMESRPENKAKVSVDVGTSSPNWLQKVTRDCAMTTALRSILNSNGSCSNFRFVNDNPRRAQLCNDWYVNQNKLTTEQEHKRNCLGLNIRHSNGSCSNLRFVNDNPRRAQLCNDWNINQNKLTTEQKHKQNCLELIKKGSHEDVKNRRAKSPNCAFVHMRHEEDVKPTPREKRRIKLFNAYPVFTSTKLGMNVSGLGTSSSEDFNSLSDDVKTIYRCSSSVPSFVSG